jgi:outer membrane protein assembly factor BamE (lipoprotein component of BamABCDE complex)
MFLGFRQTNGVFNKEENMARFIVIICFFCLCSCSVGMALSGKKEPNLGAIAVGSTRGEVEMHLGSPTASTTLEDGTRVDIYEYELGNEPSAGRAVGHGIMDVLTLGIWEVVGTPIEAVQGEKKQITITYDKNNCVKSITGTGPKKQF